MSGTGFDFADVVAEETREVERDLKQVLLSGLVLTVPFFISILVMFWVFGWVMGALSPLVGLLNALGITQGWSEILTQLTALGLVLAVVVAVGVAAQHGPDTAIAHRFDILMEDIPGIGSIYTSVEEMSDLLVAGDTESFREVKIVEFPREECYALAFLTANTPATIEDVTDSGEMLTLFVPMAPNPVMGGHLLNVPREQVYDVDLSVEDGMEAIMTTGMALDQEVMEK